MPSSRLHKYIGVDLGGTNVRAGLVVEGRVIRVEEKPIRSHGRKSEVFEDLCSVVERVYDGKIRGIGIGAPSLVDRESGMLFDSINIPSWKSVPIRKWLEEKYGVPTWIDNDANCFALGEHRFGAGRGYENVVGLIAGTGLGAGIISRGRLHSGVHCGAGEFGMIPYKDSVLEHYASGRLFKKSGQDGASLAEEARKGNLRAQRVFDELGEHLGFAIQTILFSLAPELIILGGSVGRSYPLYRHSLKKALADFPYASVRKKLKIKVSKLEHVAILGAASLVTDRV